MKIDQQAQHELDAYLSNTGSTPVITIVSAYKFNESDFQLVRKTFPGLATARLENEVDPKVLAGVRIVFGSKIIDLTLKRELHELRSLFV